MSLVSATTVVMQGKPSSGEWPKNPFPAENTASRTHGLWSDGRINPSAIRLADGLVEARPDLVSYPETVWAWARAEARCLLLEEWLEEHPLVGEDGELAPVARYVGQFERLAADLRARLGLDPKSEAELASSRAQATLVSVDIEELRARGREVLALRANS